MQRLFQLTLDFFGSALAPVAGPCEPDSPSATHQKSQAVPPVLPARPVNASHTLQEMLEPARFCHPQASRDILLEGVVVSYRLRRGKRRTIGFSAGHEGLTVSAPKWVPLYEVDKAVREKSSWIVRKLHETRERHERLESGRIEWRDGARLPYLGQQVVLKLDPAHRFDTVGAELRSGFPAHAGDSAGRGTADLVDQGIASLHIALARNATSEQIRDAVQAWLMRQAKLIFIERLNHFAPSLDVSWRKLSLSSANTRWGSASSDGSIRLNWRLVHFRQAIIDYVVVHELSHLRVMDHSPRFWDTVRSVVPDYAELRSQLRDEGAPRG